MPVSTVNLGQMLGAEPQQDLAGTISPAIKTGIQLATAQDEIQQKKIQVEQMKDDLNMKKFNNATSVLQNLARANPVIAKKMLPKVREQLIGLGADPDIADLVVSDDNMRSAAVSAIELATSDVAKNPKLAAEHFQRLMDAGMTAEAIDLHKTNLKEQQSQRNFERQMKMMEQTALRDKQRHEQQLKTDMRLETTRLGTELVKANLPELISTLKNVDKELGGLKGKDLDKNLEAITGLKGWAATVKIPFTEIMPLESTLIPDKLKPAYQSIAGLRNAYLKARSGGAVTSPEADRFLQEFGQGNIRDGAQLKAGLKHLADAVRATTRTLEAGFSPEALSTYRGRGGTSSESIPSFKQLPTASEFRAKWQGKKTPEQIEAAIKAAGLVD